MYEYIIQSQKQYKESQSPKKAATLNYSAYALHSISVDDSFDINSSNLLSDHDEAVTFVDSIALTRFRKVNIFFRYQYYALSVIALTGLFLLSSCDESPPEVTLKIDVPTFIDTTSHDFTWTVDTIGRIYSWIDDVAIISENDVWVAGRFEQNGIDGEWDGSIVGNTAHYDGLQWTIYNIHPFGRFWGGDMITLFANAPNNIWLMNSGGLHFNGKLWAVQDFRKLGYNVPTLSIWISDDDSIKVFVGGHGSIVYQRHGVLMKHPAPPDYDFFSVCGLSTGEVVIAGGNREILRGYLLKMSRNGEFTELYVNNNARIRHVDVVDDKILFTTINDLYLFEEDGPRHLFHTDYDIHGMKGNSLNDIFIITNSNIVYHYNGVDFENIGPDYDAPIFAQRLDVKHNLIYFVALGEMQRCLVFRGVPKTSDKLRAPKQLS